MNFTIPGIFRNKIQVIKRFTPALQLGIVSSLLQFHRQAKTLERRTVLDRNDLGDFLRVARTSSPRDPIALVRFRLGFYLRVSFCSSRSVRTRRQAGVRLRFPESKRTLFFCQGLFSKTAFLAHFSRILLISQYLVFSIALSTAQSCSRVFLGVFFLVPFAFQAIITYTSILAGCVRDG